MVAGGRRIGQPEFDDFDQGVIDGAATRLDTLTRGGSSSRSSTSRIAGRICARRRRRGSTPRQTGNHSERSAAALGVGNRWVRYRLCRAEVFAKRALGTTGRGGVGPYIFSGASGVLFGREAVGRHCHLLLGVPGTPAPAATRPLVDFEFCGGGACFEVVGGLCGVGH